jgi:hypothetical protein
MKNDNIKNSDFYKEWRAKESIHINDYIHHQNSFISNLLPEIAVNLSATETFQILYHRLGKNLFDAALNAENMVSHTIIRESNSDWIKEVNMVGINVRTIGSFWNMVKYALTIPASQSSIHILPIWEVGVVASLYGMSSWNINPEFFDEDLYRLIPALDTVEKQLKVSVNFLHAMGKTVGMDVIPHTDRYSEIVLANPHYFEWLQRKDLEITNHEAHLHEAIQDSILLFLEKNGAAEPLNYHNNKTAFFYYLNEKDRLEILFGAAKNYGKRLKRRNDLIQHLYNNGFEPVPATMAPPYRGLKVSESEEAKVIDKNGRVWRDYVITEPEPMSRVFGPLTRFKLYERLDNNKDWQINFEQPRSEVWEYVSQHYQEIQATYNFDFMRGDMSHVQMRPEGVPNETGRYYDILKRVKNDIQSTKPYFGYFAETFLAPAGHMAYGDEIEHLEGSDADTTLGDLQSLPVHTKEFQERLSYYWSILETHQVIPNFTMMTGDKDDPRFDSFYLKGNEARFFLGLFLGNMPSYMGLGFECRDVHEKPAPNEHYTKLYVFQIDEGPKATNGKYIWGKNLPLFEKLLEIRLLAEEILKTVHGQKTHWILAPDATGTRKILAWTQQETPKYVFIVNLDIAKTDSNIEISSFGSLGDLAHIFSTHKFTESVLISNADKYLLGSLEAGECRIYEVLD